MIIDSHGFPMRDDPHLTGKGERIIGKGESMNDLISRQAAIDALHMHLMYRMGTDSNKKRLDEWINNLPSAQPEIIRCRDCKEYYAHDHRCRWWNHGTNEAGWCYGAERREE